MGVCLVVRQHPNREIDFDCACVCVACVRAKLRVRDDSAVAGCGLVEKPGPSVRARCRYYRDDGLGRRSQILVLIASGDSVKRAECFGYRDRGSSSTFRACFGCMAARDHRCQWLPPVFPSLSWWRTPRRQLVSPVGGGPLGANWSRRSLAPILT